MGLQEQQRLQQKMQQQQQPQQPQQLQSSRHFGFGDPSPTPAQAASASAVEWVEVVGGLDGVRAFRHSASGEVLRGQPPSGWVELIADGGARYYWHVGRQVTQWERPQ